MIDPGPTNLAEEPPSPYAKPYPETMFVPLGLAGPDRGLLENPSDPALTALCWAQRWKGTGQPHRGAGLSSYRILQIFLYGDSYNI